MELDRTILAEHLRAAADIVERRAETLTDLQWQTFIETEQRTVGQLIDHIAWAWEVESAAFRAIAGGAASSDWTQEWLDSQNAEHARISAGRTREEIMQHYRASRDLALAFVQNLDTTELERSGAHMPGEPERTVAGWIDACLIGHPLEHLPAIESPLPPRS